MNFFIIFFLIFFVRTIFVVFFPETGGDYEIYSRVAKNILKGCGVSLSDPLSNDCVPHFGGNHGPGYDAFIALVWYFTDYSNNAVRITQTLIYSLFCLYTLYAIQKFIKNKILFFSIGILFVISPLLVAWPRYVQTETLSIAASIYLLSELIFNIRFA